MEHTKQNIARLLVKKEDLYFKLSRKLKECGEIEEATKYYDAAGTLMDVVRLLTDKDYFNDIAEIFLKEE